jgi:hypothetical protein
LLPNVCDARHPDHAYFGELKRNTGVFVAADAEWPLPDALRTIYNFLVLTLNRTGLAVGIDADLACGRSCGGIGYAIIAWGCHGCTDPCHGETFSFTASPS